MTGGVKMLAALLGADGDSEKLLGAARDLMDAFSDLLKCAQPDSQQVIVMEMSLKYTEHQKKKRNGLLITSS